MRRVRCDWLMAAMNAGCVAMCQQEMVISATTAKDG
jgi:hypothetical protein